MKGRRGMGGAWGAKGGERRIWGEGWEGEGWRGKGKRVKEDRGRSVGGGRT